MGDDFYGPELARIHHEGFGFLARASGPRLLAELDRAGIGSGLVVELGCGSGIQTRIVTDAGFDVLGIDLSAGMLELARANVPGATYRHESLIDAELPSCVAVTAAGEPLNYLADPRAGLETLEVVFAKVFDALQPRGIFLFDLSMPGRGGPSRRHERFFHDATWVLGMEQEEAEDGATLWREQTFFVRAADGNYRRADERHVLRLYPEPDIEAALSRAGFTWTTDTEYQPDPDPKHRTTYGGWRVFVAQRPA